MWSWLIVLGLLAYFGYNRYLHPLAKVPGPFWASITPLWLVWQIWNRRRPRFELELHKKYGSVVRLAPNQVMFSNSDYFKQVYGAGTNFVKSRWYEAPTDKSRPDTWDKLDMLTEMNLDKLRLQKRYVGPIYSTHNTQRHENMIDNNINRWFQRLSQHCDRPLDFYKEIELLFVDIMTEITYAEPFGAVERGTDGGQMHTMHNMWRWWSMMGTIPWWNEFDKTWSPWARFFMNPNYSSILPIFSFAMKKLGEYDQGGKDTEKKPCIYDDLCNLSKEKPEFLKSWGIMLSVTNEGAGIETLSWTFASVLVGVLSNPEILAKVKGEIEQAVEDGLIEEDVPVPYDEAIKMPYLQACLNEAQRIWPNVGQPLLRKVPKEGITIDGYFIPGGYDIGMQSKQLGLDRKIFGEDVEAFRPERWLEASKQQRNMMETMNLAFGSPHRKCPGMHLAWVALTKVATSFFRDWDVEILNELNGAPGPGGSTWTEQGTFTTTWSGWEISVHPSQQNNLQS